MILKSKDETLLKKDIINEPRPAFRRYISRTN